MLQIQNLSFSYRKPQVRLFDDFSLDLEPGNIYGLLGKNGAGKSTLVYLMSGLLTPTSGSVMLNGVDVRRRLPVTLQEQFLIPEEFQLPDLTLAGMVKLNAPLYPHFSHNDLTRYLDIFEIDPAMQLKSLSMGQKKKVFMAFAFAANTAILVMDEPTNGLDIPGKSQFRKIMAQCMTDDKVILISTHQVRDVDSILDHILIIEQSKVLLNASVADIAGKLAFHLNPDGSKALYLQPTIGGQMVIEPNTDGVETSVDLEMLFNATLSNSARINQLFNDQSK